MAPTSDATNTSGAAQRGRRRRLRELWVTLHLTLGLTVGAIVALAGITGSLLVFYVELDRVIDPAVATSRATTPPRPIEDVFRTLRAAHPERDRAWRLELPMTDGDPVTARYYRAKEKAHVTFAPLIVRIDPRTLEVGPARFWGDFAMTWIYDLHYTLLLDRTGRTIMAIVGIVLLVSLASGLVLWWPSSGRWRSALAWKPRASTERRTYDLHKLSGVWGVVLLAILALTGTMLGEPKWFVPAIDRVSPLFVAPAVAATPSDVRITIDEAVRIARGRFPAAEPRWIETPDGPEGVYRVQLHQPGEPGRRFPKTNVWIDPGTGVVLAVRDPKSEGAGDTVLAWLHPLHSGEAFGLVGRIVVLLAGFSPPLLFVTGVMRWRQKRRARQADCADRRR